jgi:DNA polymerase
LPVTERFKREFKSMTGLNPTQTKKINHWVVTSLPMELKFLALRSDGKPSLDKRTNLPALLEHPNTPEQIRQALQVLSEARKSSLSKLDTLKDLVHNGRISGAYVFNGASATGRFSSKGAQVHNLPKASLDPETLDRLLQEDTQRVIGTEPDQEGLIYWRDLPKLASKALRSLITPRQGVMVWVDWSAIEACVLPWLTLDPRTEGRLDVLRRDGDIYMVTVKDVWGVEDRKLRPAGKVMELALGFCGGLNAMDTFCRNLGVALTDEEKVFGLSAWREANQWALDFGDRLMEAFINAYYGEATTVGRVEMIPWPQFKGVAMVLPNRRQIVYPQVSLTADGAEFSKFLANGSVSRVPVWRGLLSENATQGTAASLLRSKIAQVESSHPQPVGSILVGTTHDEMILECSDPRMAERTAIAISRVMVTPPPWLQGCPLNVEWQYGRRYSMKEAEGRVRGIDLETNP